MDLQAMQKMDQVSGLSDNDMQAMDHVSGLGNNQPSGMMDNPVGKVVDFVAPAIKSNYNVVKNQMDYQKTLPNTQGDLGASINNAVNSTGHLASQLPGAGLSDAETILNMLGGKALVSGGVATAKVLPQLPKYLSKGGLANLTEQAASKATEAGQSIHWDDLMAQAKKEVIKKFGDNAATRQALGSVTSPRVPAGVEAVKGSLHQTPEQLLQLRRNLSNSYGNRIFQGAGEGGVNALEQKVASTFRGVVSKSLHQLAPETIKPDQFYTLYSKFSGPVAKELFKVLGIPTVAGLLGAEAFNAFKK
jgi:hypothetical protein